jgi:hypothetical protein
LELKNVQVYPRASANANRVQTDGPVRLLDFRQDEHGDWLAVLSCGHTQHLRHQPPWQNRAWVMDAEQRQARIGEHFDCGWCAADHQGAEAGTDHALSASSKEP